MKTEGVPVEFNVATIFDPIIALLPIPLTITLPDDEWIFLIAFSKSAVRYLCKFNIAFPWFTKLSFAIFKILSIDFNLVFLNKV